MFVISFESIFEKCLHLGELCNDSRLYKNVYNVFTFENISFESVGVFENVLKMVVSKQLRAF